MRIGYGKPKRTTGPPDRLAIGNLTMDRVRFEVHLSGREIRLTRKEFDLLWILCSDAGRVFRRQNLLDQVWKEGTVEARTIDAHIVRIRKKLHTETIISPSIETVWGIGYRLKLRLR